MTNEEFFEWLDTCPTHKWEVMAHDNGYVNVCFPIEEDEEDE